MRSLTFHLEIGQAYIGTDFYRELPQSMHRCARLGAPSIRKMHDASTRRDGASKTPSRAR